MNTPNTTSPAKSLLLDRVRDKIRLKHYSIRTEAAYVDWIRRFVIFHQRRHPRDLGAEHVEAFLTHLAVQRNVAASTQNQAKSALLFLYKEVLGSELPWLDNVENAKRPARLPVVLTRQETQTVLIEHSTIHDRILSQSRFPHPHPSAPLQVCPCPGAEELRVRERRVMNREKISNCATRCVYRGLCAASGNTQPAARASTAAARLSCRPPSARRCVA